MSRGHLRPLACWPATGPQRRGTKRFAEKCPTLQVFKASNPALRKSVGCMLWALFDGRGIIRVYSLL